MGPEGFVALTAGVMILGAAIWAFVGGCLLWVSARGVRRISACGFWPCWGANILGSLWAFVVLLAGWIAAPAGTAGMLTWLLCCVLCAAGFWLLVKVRLHLPGRQAALACLAPGGILLIALILTAVALPREVASARLQRARRWSSSFRIARALQAYFLNNWCLPPRLLTLERMQLVEKGDLLGRWPSDGGADGARTPACFYLPVSGRLQDASPGRILVCELRRVPPPSGRHVIYANLKVVWLTEAEFQAELNTPENAPFAEALRHAERHERE